MKIKHKSTGIYEVAYSPWKLLSLLAFLATALVFVMVMTRPSEAGGLIRLIGSSICLLIVIICAVQIYERSRFTFDAQHQILIWQRKSLGAHEKGRVPFDRIESIYLEGISEPKLEDWFGERIMIQTRLGSIPMTENHFKQGTFPLQEIADDLRRLVGNSPNKPLAR